MTDSITAFRMQLKSGFETEYQRRHDELWPELRAALTDAGIVEYRIFLDPDTRSLFAYQRLASGADTSVLPGLPIVKKWWAYMADLMDVHPDNEPISVTCPPVFCL